MANFSSDSNHFTLRREAKNEIMTFCSFILEPRKQIASGVASLHFAAGDGVSQAMYRRPIKVLCFLARLSQCVAS